MPIDLYYHPASSPCRAVHLVAKALNLDVNIKPVDLLKGEHKSPEFLKMNPQHAVPTLNDNGFCLSESRAIMAYLVNQYGKNDQLYPKDPKARAVVDQRLYFDACTLYQRTISYYAPKAYPGYGLDDPAAIDRLDEAYQIFNTILEGQTWVAGPNMTIADLTLAATVATTEAVGISVSKYPNVQKWYTKIQKEAPGFEVNLNGAKTLRELYLSFTSKK